MVITHVKIEPITQKTIENGFIQINKSKIIAQILFLAFSSSTAVPIPYQLSPAAFADEQMMQVISRTAAVSAIQRILFFIQLRQRRFDERRG